MCITYVSVVKEDAWHASVLFVHIIARLDHMRACIQQLCVLNQMWLRMYQS